MWRHVMAADAGMVIIGAGHGGAELAVSLREQGWTGRIVLVGEEPVLPYHRPPLSKAYLAGEATAQSLQLRADASYAKVQVERLSGVRALAIDRQAHMV